MWQETGKKKIQFSQICSPKDLILLPLRGEMNQTTDMKESYHHIQNVYYENKEVIAKELSKYSSA